MLRLLLSKSVKNQEISVLTLSHERVHLSSVCSIIKRHDKSNRFDHSEDLENGRMSSYFTKIQDLRCRSVPIFQIPRFEFFCLSMLFVKYVCNTTSQKSINPFSVIRMTETGLTLLRSVKILHPMAHIHYRRQLKKQQQKAYCQADRIPSTSIKRCISFNTIFFLQCYSF